MGSLIDEGSTIRIAELPNVLQGATVSVSQVLSRGKAWWLS